MDIQFNTNILETNVINLACDQKVIYWEFSSSY